MLCLTYTSPCGIIVVDTRCVVRSSLFYPLLMEVMCMLLCEYDDNLWVTDTEDVLLLPDTNPDLNQDVCIRFTEYLTAAPQLERTAWRRAPRCLKRALFSSVVTGGTVEDAFVWLLDGLFFEVEPKSLINHAIDPPASLEDPDSYLGREQ